MRPCISCWESVGATPMVDTTQVPRYGDKRYISQIPVWGRFDATQALQTPEGQTKRFCCRSDDPRIRTTASGNGQARRIGELEKSDDKKLSDLCYDLATGFYEFGWGSSFHFARRVPGESFKASLARHEHYLANSYSGSNRTAQVLMDSRLAGNRIGCGRRRGHLEFQLAN